MTGTVTETLPVTSPSGAAPRLGRFKSALPDALIPLALGTVALIVRHHVSADGLFYDDAWQAFGAWKGSLFEVITVGQTQPGFTAGLMLWTRVFGMGTASLVTPAMIAGTLGPPLLYLAFRRFGYARSVAFLAGAALTGAEVHISYSYHVKTYTFDVLIILGLALAVWSLAPRRWATSTAAAWSIGSITIGSFSSIALIGTLVAGVVLVLHPSGDLRRRAAAVAVQLIILSALYLASSRTYNDSLIHDFFAPRGGYIEFDPNPVTFGRELFDHFWNVADVFPGGIPTLSLAFAGFGLVVAAWGGRLAVPARFLALAVVVAVVGSIVDRIPFGPPRAQGRVTLWMVPAIAVGLCTALDVARRRVAGRLTLRAGFDTILWIGAVLVMVSALGTDARYPAGGRSAIRQVMADLRPDDAVLITKRNFYSFALYANTPVHLRPTPERSIGFLPDFPDGRLHLFDFGTRAAELADFVDHVERVHVVYAGNRGAYGEDMSNLLFGIAMFGFERQSTTTVATGHIEVWQRKHDAPL
jgi:hypothetical protein